MGTALQRSIAADALFLVHLQAGRQVKRADGVLMEEVITTRKEGNQLVSTTSYRPVGQKEVLKPANDELLDLEALLDGAPGAGDGSRPSHRPQQEGRQPRAQAPQNPRHTPQESSQAKAAPVAVGGEDTTMARLAALKQLYQNGDVGKEECGFVRCACPLCVFGR